MVFGRRQGLSARRKDAASLARAKAREATRKWRRKGLKRLSLAMGMGASAAALGKRGRRGQRAPLQSGSTGVEKLQKNALKSLETWNRLQKLRAPRCEEQSDEAVGPQAPDVLWIASLRSQ